MTIKRWDIYWARVRYEDSTEIKRRPVLIINNNTAFIICLKITSQNRGDNPPEYVIQEWQKSGLPKESFIMHDKYIRLNPCDLDEKIGKLHEMDQLRLGLRLSS